MQSLPSLLSIEKQSKTPVYLQIANQLTELIRKGTLSAGHRLPSTRQLADLLSIHRKTVVQAYDELLVQGWLESRVGHGTFVASAIPENQPQSFTDVPVRNPRHTAGFTIPSQPHLQRPLLQMTLPYHLDDGFPDPRLAPMAELSRAYRSQLLTHQPYSRLGYRDTLGSYELRQELSAYLNQTRGMHTTPDNILIVRGTIMGLYLACTGLLQPGDTVVTDEWSWSGATMNFTQAGARILRIPVDEYGIDVDALAQLCQQQTIRMVYVTSHHHYPTTVALRPDRRMQLLRLAETYGFIVFEDDYDYDFHYLSKPLLPLASADQAGMVLYCGSFTKTISPAFRVGYLIGSENVIRHLANLRRIIDRQGDLMLENAFAELLKDGIIERHLRKSVRLYRQRRDVFCELLQTHLNSTVDFKIPEGGMAVWTHFDTGIDLNNLSERAAQKGLYVSNGRGNPSVFQSLNAIRLGFASSTEPELEHSVWLLRQLIRG